VTDVRSHRATVGPAPVSAVLLLTVLVLLLGEAACGSDRPAPAGTEESPARTATPDPDPSVWTTAGSPAAARAASAALLRVTDLPGDYTPSPLTVLSPRAVHPPACRTLVGPGTGLLDGATGEASTAFVGKDLSAAVAHSVGIYATPAAGAAAVDRARRLGRTCSRTVVDGTAFSVTSLDRPGASGAPAVTLVLRQAHGVGQTTVTLAGRLVSVLAIASRPPGPRAALVQQAAWASTQRLTAAGAAAGA
jgi:hypothetical protein